MKKNNTQIISSQNENKSHSPLGKTDLAKIASKSKPTVVLKAVHMDKVAEWKRLAFNEENPIRELVLQDDRKNLPLRTKKLLPKIVGDMKHYPPANKEWKNSVYAYNKNSLRSIAALDKRAAKTIKSYFNLTINKNFARSYRMRNLIRRSTSRRIFASKPEIKQTSNKVNITVYILNREGQYLLRKIYFYKKNMNVNRDIYLHKIWLEKNLLAFRKTFKARKNVRLLTRKKKLMTKRKTRNKTYIHNTIIKRYLRQNKDFKTFRNPNFSNHSKNKARKPESSVFKKTNPQQSFLSISKLSNLRKVNILNSFRKRSLIRSLKKLRVFKDASPISVAVTSYNSEKELTETNSYGIKTFGNYLQQKKSQKLEVKIRNRTSTVKIKKTLSKFFFLTKTGKKGKRLIRRKKRFKKIRFPYSNFKFKNEVKFFSFKLVSELKHIRKLFLFRFLKYLFSILNIQIYFTKPERESELLDYVIKNRKVKDTVLDEQRENNAPYYYLKYKGDTSCISKDRNPQNTSQGKASNINVYEAERPKMASLAFSHSKLNKLEQLNLELLNFLKFILTGKRHAETLALNNSENFSAIFAHLYKKYEKKYFLRYLGKYFKKEFLYINYFSKLMMNRFKLGKFLPGLKSLINKIYSKKVKLNIVNLKYPHLNTDIFAESITSKLRKKLSLLRVMRSSLRLAKLPSEYLSYDRLGEYNKLASLTIHKTLNVDDISQKPKSGVANKGKTISALTEKQLEKDSLDLVLTKLYPHSFVTTNLLQLNDLKDSKSFANKKDESLSEGDKWYNDVTVSPAKNLKILNIIRYKWVSGVRLEAAGRLTRRYTAARSVFKFRYKGSLKNIDYSQKSDRSKKNASAVMLRNHAKANSQYSFSKSKRRIGAFGLKAWIASY